jgi:putative acetyltransferase
LESAYSQVKSDIPTKEQLSKTVKKNNESICYYTPEKIRNQSLAKNEVKVVEYVDKYRESLLTVWEKSVLATHSFLKPSDFQFIKETVHTIELNSIPVYCLVDSEDQAIGFIGVANKKVEMLFLAPDYFGKGQGKKLMDFAIHNLKAFKVDVNEQNEKAVEFYQKLGFETFERSEKDDQGNDFPLLRMKLKNNQKDGSKN